MIVKPKNTQVLLEMYEPPKEDKKSKIRESLEKRFEVFYKELGVVNSKDIVDKTTKIVTVPLTDIDFGDNQTKEDDVQGLDD